MNKSRMALEAREAPQRIAVQLAANAALMQQVVEAIRARAPKFVYTIGRGSSDHAGVFAKYLIEIELGLPVVAAALSIASVYGKSLQLSDALVLVISQSGRSPDVLSQVEMARNSGAMVVALVNDVSSPVAQRAHFTLPLHVGAEIAIAATKSCLGTLSALLQLVSVWSDNAELQRAVTTLPQKLHEAMVAPAQLNSVALEQVTHLMVLGRGPGYAIAREIALKLKEVCAIHAEAFSSAEFLHGPVTLVRKQFVIVDVSVDDESRVAHRDQIDDFKARGAGVTQLHHRGQSTHRRLIPLLVLQRFYLDVEAVARSRGINPDAPPGLNKVTRTA